MSTFAPPAKRPSLRRGMTSADVALWQQVVGIIPPTGYFGDVTKAATVRWQNAHGLSPTGEVGPAEWAAAEPLPPPMATKPTSPAPTPAPAPAPKPSPTPTPAPTATPPTTITGGGAGHAFAASLPPNAGEAREAMILAAVRNGRARIQWATITHEEKGHTLRLPVFADALAIGDATDFVRVNVNMRTQQAIADFLGALLITSKVSDLIYRAAQIKIPFQGLVDGSPKSFQMMATTEWMVRQSDIVERKRQAAGMSGIIADTGKDWVLSLRLLERGPWPDGRSRPPPENRSANYGGRNASGVPVQSVGITHDLVHTDYSQHTRLMGNTAEVDGQPMAVADILKSPELSYLLSNEGPLPFSRHPLLGMANA